MDVDRGAEATFERGDDGRFAGEVWLRGSGRAPDGTNVGVVHFSPASRTHWHRHPGGQWLFGVTGRGRVRSRDAAAGHVLEPGDVVFVDAGEWHYHGAERDTPVVHVAVNVGGAPDWGEPVSDAEYDEGF
jgi:quercetin dioxygenase-like cupin family protein